MAPTFNIHRASSFCKLKARADRPELAELRQSAALCNVRNLHELISNKTRLASNQADADLIEGLHIPWILHKPAATDYQHPQKTFMKSSVVVAPK
jgi:hypothetical protein